MTVKMSSSYSSSSPSSCTCSYCHKPIHKHENRISVIDGKKGDGKEKVMGTYHVGCYWDCV